MKKKNLILTILLFIIIVFVVISIYLVVRVQNTEENTSSQKKNNVIPKENSLIDMNNINNVKIEEGKKENTSPELLKEKIISGIRIRDISLVAENGLTNFTAEVRNIGTHDLEARDITIVFRNADGTEFERLSTFLPDLKIGETTRIDASVIADLSNAYDFTIE